MSFHTLMFGWEYPPIHLGGLGVACQGMVRGLLKHGARVTLVLPHPNPAQENGLDIVHPTEEMKQVVQVRSMLTPYDSHAAYEGRMRKLPKNIGEMYGLDLHDAIHQFTEASVEMTKHVSPDVIHSHDWMTYEAGARAANHHQKSLVAHIHATELDRTHFNPNEWIYKKERDGFEAANKIIAVSNYTKNMLITHYGIAPDKIAVVHNGNSDDFAPTHSVIESRSNKKDKPMVLFLGRLTIQKGAWQFLEMAAQIHALRDDVQFVVAGDGNMLGELIQRACDLGLQDCTMFAGMVNSAEAKKLYAQADCFVMPSVSEPFGLVALEAIAQGTPVVLSNQSGASEVVGHCFKVDFWDTAKMADCVLTVLREEPLARQLRSEAPRVLHHLTWENQAGHILSVYNDTIRASTHA